MANSIKNALYVVATPIGNLDDITIRALDVLKNVDIVAAEDTRTTSILFNHYNISTKLISYHKYSENSRIELFLNYLRDGKSIALVSDAGTPLISDPGNILVKNVIENNFEVIPIVGASAIIALLSSVYRKGEDFKFIGFIEKGEKKIIETVQKNNLENLVFYESPNRLISTLTIIQKNYPTKTVTVARELTKKFEEIKTDTVENIIEYYTKNTLKGEIAVLLHKFDSKEEIDIIDKINKLKKLNLKDKEISNILSTLYNLNKKEVYNLCINKE